MHEGQLLHCSFCPPMLVEGDYSNGFVHPYVDTILSPQLLLQFSRDFDETVIVPMT